MKWNLWAVSPQLGKHIREGVAESAVPRELTRLLESIEHVLGAGLPFTIVIQCEPVSEANPHAGGDPTG
jgi:hypothetical protein